MCVEAQQLRPDDLTRLVWTALQYYDSKKNLQPECESSPSKRHSSCWSVPPGSQRADCSDDTTMTVALLPYLLYLLQTMWRCSPTFSTA